MPLRVKAGAVWFAALVLWIAVLGFSTDRLTVVFWVVTGLIAFTLGTRPWWQAPLDWAPIIVFFVVYDATRGAADLFGFPTLWEWPADADRWLSFGEVPSVWLQERFAAPGSDVPAWEIIVGATYLSHFIIPFVLGGWLWVRARPVFTGFMTRLALVSTIGVLCYVVVPAAPPWAAARCTTAEVATQPADPQCMSSATPSDPSETVIRGLEGQQEGFPPVVTRITSRGWDEVPGMQRTRGFIQDGISASNKVAAIPSLHAAGAMLVSAFLWRRVRRRWWPLLIVYPPLMGASLVYGGDHYIVDVLLGWVVVGASMLIVGRWERWRSSRQASPDAVAAA